MLEGACYSRLQARTLGSHFEKSVLVKYELCHVCTKGIPVGWSSGSDSEDGSSCMGMEGIRNEHFRLSSTPGHSCKAFSAHSFGDASCIVNCNRSSGCESCHSCHMK